MAHISLTLLRLCPDPPPSLKTTPRSMRRVLEWSYRLYYGFFERPLSITKGPTDCVQTPGGGCVLTRLIAHEAKRYRGFKADQKWHSLKVHVQRDATQRNIIVVGPR